jgi:hypothetical protein
MRFTQEGILVKSIEVPEVDATAVPETIGAKVPDTATKVCVVVPDIVGAANVTEPLVSPERTTDAILFPYRITQRLPLGIVTDLPLSIVIGPTLLALRPEVIV